MDGNGNALIEPFGAPEFFVDGFDDYRLIDGIMYCAGYRIQSNGERQVIVRLILPARVLEDIIAKARGAREMSATDIAVENLH